MRYELYWCVNGIIESSVRWVVVRLTVFWLVVTGETVTTMLTRWRRHFFSVSSRFFLFLTKLWFFMFCSLQIEINVFRNFWNYSFNIFYFNSFILAKLTQLILFLNCTFFLCAISFVFDIKPIFLQQNNENCSFFHTVNCQ